MVGASPVAVAVDPDLLLGVVLFVGFIAFAVLNVVWFFRRSGRMLDQHLLGRGYRVVERQYRWFARGPFFWTTTKGQAVYRYTAEDLAEPGRLRRGWARCGGFFFGLLTNRVDLRWDDEGERPAAPGFPVVMGEQGR